MAVSGGGRGVGMGRRGAGFTLVEVLVGMGIALVVVAAAYAALAGGIAVYERAGAVTQEVQVVRALAERLTRELQAAYFDPQASDLVFEGEQPDESLLHPASRLTFVTVAGPGPLTEVEYFLQEFEPQPYDATATARPGGLYRRASPLLERSSPGAQGAVEVAAPESAASEEGEAVLLAPEVVGFEVAYYDPQAAAASGALGLRGSLTGAEPWEDSWDASTKGYLPRAVRVTLYLGAWPEGGQAEEEGRRVTFVVTLPLAEEAAAPQEGSSGRGGLTDGG